MSWAISKFLFQRIFQLSNTHTHTYSVHSIAIARLTSLHSRNCDSVQYGNNEWIVTLGLCFDVPRCSIGIVIVYTALSYEKQWFNQRLPIYNQIQWIFFSFTTHVCVDKIEIEMKPEFTATWRSNNDKSEAFVGIVSSPPPPGGGGTPGTQTSS